MIEPRRSSPTVSVVMPTYNRAHLLPAVIQSILSQDFQDLELVVVDDGSTDETPAVVSEIQARDPRVRYVALRENRGIGFAREFGRQQSCGRYVSVADSDDPWLPGRLRAQVEVLEAYPQVDVLFGDFWNVDHVRGTEGSGLEETQAGMEPLVTHQLDDDLWLIESGVEVGLLRSNFIAAPTAVVRTTVFDDVGGFAAMRAVDFEFWWRAAVLGARYAYIDRPLIERYRYRSSMSADIHGGRMKKLDALDMCRQTCRKAGRPELLSHIHAAENEVWRILIRNRAEQGQRMEVWRTYRSSLRNGFSLRTLLYFVVGLGGPWAMSLAMRLWQVQKSLLRRG